MLQLHSFYLVRIIYQLKMLGVTKTELRKTMNEFEELVEKYKKKYSNEYLVQIIYTDHSSKIAKLKEYHKFV